MSRRDYSDGGWVFELGRLRRRAVHAGLGKTVAEPATLNEVFQDALNTCASLIQEVSSGRREIHVLTEQLKREQAAWNQLFTYMPVAVIGTDRNGSIVCANQLASALLNTSRKRLVSQLLLHFTTDRPQFTALLQMPVADAPRRTGLTIRPRERAPIDVEAILTAWDPGDAEHLLWFLIPAALKGGAAEVSLRPAADRRSGLPCVEPENDRPAG